MLESIEASIEHIRSILSSRSSKTEYSFKLNNINIDALKDLICLLKEFKNVSLLVQICTRPSLHMAYIGINKLEHHLTGADFDQNDDLINIDDRREAAILHPLYRELTFATSYFKSTADMYIREQLDEILGLNKQQHAPTAEPSKKKHKKMEDQFADPDDDVNNYDVNVTSTTIVKNDELERYLRMNIEDKYKQSNPLPFWRDHQTKFPALSLLARRLFSIPINISGGRASVFTWWSYNYSTSLFS
ncbi:unnamed protein product [Rotaria socialis]|uniref:HAT C-terminal dimerisation domain-containing protein n=1 Tax=Rotaria socialis TaxID=392032 RepID=A0A817XV98_9BILA|nr:unnamed protein product [Rotaria socialis]CAF3370929.1 unnamed protein product [Rotaria socialis]